MGHKPRTSHTSGLATRPTRVSAHSFIRRLPDERRQRDSTRLLTLMTEVTGESPVMWGTSIVGFGTYRYKNGAGREGEWPRTGFSPRKHAMTIYCMPGFAHQRDLLSRLGPHKTGASCLYIRHLDDVDLDVLRAIVARTLEQMERIYGR